MSSAAFALHAPVAPVPKGLVARGTGGFRACELCVHAMTTIAGGLLCASPAALLGGGAEPLQSARAVDGSCGPNARHLDMHAWAT